MTFGALLTDLYELTMSAAYLAKGLRAPAVFELFARRLGPDRGFLIAAGVEEALTRLENLKFSDEEIAYLRELPELKSAPENFWEWLGGFRFQGEVWAAPEGTVLFAGEPILIVRDELPSAQILETLLLNAITFPSAVATKAARIYLAARGRPVVEFGARRAQGAEAALSASRAAFIGGCVGTSHLAAGKKFGIPVFGTMAHSFVLAFPREADAFRAWMETFPEGGILLLDTYEVREALEQAMKLGAEKLKGVRIDSGDLAAQARSIRKKLDSEGFRETKIFASGDLNEFRIAKLLRSGAPIDAFGVGTELSTSWDAPALSTVYKLTEIDGRGVFKSSIGKRTLPGRKQVFREIQNQKWKRDWLGLAGENLPGSPVLEKVMENGKRLRAPEKLSEISERAKRQLRELPAALLKLRRPQAARVKLSPRLALLAK